MINPDHDFFAELLREGGAVKCVGYTRKSNREGLDMAFNSLEAQREAIETYVAGKAAQGWLCLPDRYDDGGFSGADLNRPALRRLVEDAHAGKFQVVVVYKIDRMSRSLLDFARLIELFEKHRIAFVSTTQAFNTSTSMGRLVLNMLLSFAQFEREMIAERTKDKIAASRKRGKWTGGIPPLGYDIAPGGGKLLVNEAEAERVRQIFKLYLAEGSLLFTVLTCNQRNWRTKRWVTKKGVARGGKPFHKTNLIALLTHRIYRGQIRHGERSYPGEHEAIVPKPLWEAVQERLRANRPPVTSPPGNRETALLAGLLRCKHGDCAMYRTYAGRGAKLRFPYYQCVRAQKQGCACPVRRLPVAEAEDFVISQIESWAMDPAPVRSALETLAAERLRQIRETRQAITQTQARLHKQQKSTKAQEGPELAELEQRLRSLTEKLIEWQETRLDEATLCRGLRLLLQRWSGMAIEERHRRLGRVFEAIHLDGRERRLIYDFNVKGLQHLEEDLKREGGVDEVSDQPDDPHPQG